MNAPTRAGLVLALTACGGPGPTFDPSYADAAARPGDLEACQAVSAPSRREECTALAIHHKLLSGEWTVDAALDGCRAMDGGSWRDECVFLISDAAELAGEAAQRVCAEAGQFRFQCVGHAINRGAEAVFAAHTVGQEPEVHAALLAVVGSYIGGGEATAKSRRLLITHIGARLPDQPFALSACGNAPEDLCVAAYAERVRLKAKDNMRTWRHACGSEVSVERVAQFDLPVWTPDFDPMAALAWKELCSR